MHQNISALRYPRWISWFSPSLKLFLIAFNLHPSQSYLQRKRTSTATHGLRPKTQELNLISTPPSFWISSWLSILTLHTQCSLNCWLLLIFFHHYATPSCHMYCPGHCSGHLMYLCHPSAFPPHPWQAIPQTVFREIFKIHNKQNKTNSCFPLA